MHTVVGNLVEAHPPVQRPRAGVFFDGDRDRLTGSVHPRAYLVQAWGRGYGHGRAIAVAKLCRILTLESLNRIRDNGSHGTQDLSWPTAQRALPCPGSTAYEPL